MLVFSLWISQMEFFFSLFAILLLLLLLFKLNAKFHFHHLPPAPPSIPFIGNWQFFSSSQHISFSNISKKYGPIFSLRVGHRPIIVISSEKIIQEAIKNHDIAFSGRVKSKGCCKLSYGCSDIAFTEYGDYWKQVRRVGAVNLFSSKMVQSHSQSNIRENFAADMKSAVCNAADRGEVVDINDMILSLNSRIVCTMAFGRGGWDEGKFSKVFYDSQAMLGGVFMEDYWPVVGKLLDFISGMDARLGKNFREMDSFFSEVIQNRICCCDRVKKVEEEKNDFLDVLLKLNQCGELSMNQVKAVLMNVIIAGTDTSAATIIWVMTELMKNQKEMKKVQHEMRTIIGKKDTINQDEINKLSYMKDTIKETLRLHPVAPLLVPRETIHVCTVGGYQIPPKAMVIINCWGIGRDPESWQNPEEFLPERFVGSDVDFFGRHFGLIPFGVGRRICPGIVMGVAVVEILLANLLYSFDWKLPTGIKSSDIDDEMLPGITTQKKNHLLLFPHKVV